MEKIMDIDFSGIPEYVLFKDLTSLDEMNGRVVIDLDYEPTHFKKEDRKTVFRELLSYYKENNFKDLLDEYIMLLSRRSYSSLSSIGSCDNFAFNHPIVVMIYEFIGQGLITKYLEINLDVKLLKLGENIYERKDARELKIGEGVVFADGTLMPIESKDAHKIATLWMILNGRNLKKAIRYTDDCIHPEPIFTSMNEYAKIGNGEIKITSQQAMALYNIHLAKSRAQVPFTQILFNSSDLCVTVDGNPEVRYENLKMLERTLGADVIKAREVLEDIKYGSAMFGTD